MCCSSTPLATMTTSALGAESLYLVGFITVVTMVMVTGTPTDTAVDDCVRTCEGLEFLETCKHFEVTLDEAINNNDVSDTCTQLQELFKCIAGKSTQCLENANLRYQQYIATPWNCTLMTEEIILIAQKHDAASAPGCNPEGGAGGYSIPPDNTGENVKNTDAAQASKGSNVNDNNGSISGVVPSTCLVQTLLYGVLFYVWVVS